MNRFMPTSIFRIIGMHVFCRASSWLRAPKRCLPWSKQLNEGRNNGQVIRRNDQMKCRVTTSPSIAYCSKPTAGHMRRHCETPTDFQQIDPNNTTAGEKRPRSLAPEYDLISYTWRHHTTSRIWRRRREAMAGCGEWRHSLPTGKPPRGAGCYITMQRFFFFSYFSLILRVCSD